MIASQEQLSLRQQLIRHQVAVKAGLITMGSILLILVGLWPLVQSSGTLLRKIETRDKEAKALSQKVSLLSQIDQNVLAERTNTIKRALPENKDVISYLTALDGLSKELGLSFGGIVVSPGTIKSAEAESKKKTSGKTTGRTAGRLEVLDTTIKITGEQSAIYDFLRQVEQTLPLMQVSDVNVTTLGQGQYAVTLTLGMLWAPTPPSDLKGAISLFTEREEDYFQRLAGFRSYVFTPNAGESDGLTKLNLFEQD